MSRVWAKEWHFRIGVHHLRGLIDAETSGVQYADLADAVVAAMWPVVLAEFTRKHGGCRERVRLCWGWAVLGRSGSMRFPTLI